MIAKKTLAKPIAAAAKYKPKVAPKAKYAVSVKPKWNDGISCGSMQLKTYMYAAIPSSAQMMAIANTENTDVSKLTVFKLIEGRKLKVPVIEVEFE